MIDEDVGDSNLGDDIQRTGHERRQRRAHRRQLNERRDHARWTTNRSNRRIGKGRRKSEAAWDDQSDDHDDDQDEQ